MVLDIIFYFFFHAGFSLIYFSKLCYNNYIKMTDLVDFMYDQEISILSKNYSKKPETKQVEITSKTSFNKITIQLDQQIKPIYEDKFIQIDTIWTSTVRLFVQSHILRFSFQLLRNSQIFRVETPFIKNYLANLFSKDNNSLLQPKINPVSGEISLQISCLHTLQNLKKPNQYKQKILELNFLRNKILSIWKNIISISQGNFGFDNHLVGKQKTLQMKILSILSTIQNQSQNVHNIKNVIQNQKQKQNISSNNTSITKQLQNYLLTRKEQQKPINFQYRKNMQYILRQKKSLHYNTIRHKVTYSNFQKLNLQQKQKINLIEQIKKIKFQQMVKVNDSSYGKLFLNYQNVSLGKQQQIISTLEQFDNKFQYNFLNYYFILNQNNNNLTNNNRKFLFKMALKKVNLQQFLTKNANCLSFQNKLKIFMQIYFAIQTVWDKYKIYIGYFNMTNISITKTLIAKLQVNQNWMKIDQDSQDISDYQRFFYKSQMMIRINKLFSQIFCNKNIYTSRPMKKMAFKSIIKNDKIHSILSNKVDQKINNLHLYGFKEILQPISYSLQKYEQFNSVQQINQQFLGHMIQLKNKYLQGNLDLILGILFKSLELIKLTQ